jgi:hypothetical protein
MLGGKVRFPVVAGPGSRMSSLTMMITLEKGFRISSSACLLRHSWQFANTLGIDRAMREPLVQGAARLDRAAVRGDRQ